MSYYAESDTEPEDELTRKRKREQFQRECEAQCALREKEEYMETRTLVERSRNKKRRRLNDMNYDHNRNYDDMDNHSIIYPENIGNVNIENTLKKLIDQQQILINHVNQQKLFQFKQKSLNKKLEIGQNNINRKQNIIDRKQMDIDRNQKINRKIVTNVAGNLITNDAKREYNQNVINNNLRNRDKVLLATNSYINLSNILNGQKLDSTKIKKAVIISKQKIIENKQNINCIQQNLDSKQLELDKMNETIKKNELLLIEQNKKIKKNTSSILKNTKSISWNNQITLKNEMKLKQLKDKKYDIIDTSIADQSIRRKSFLMDIMERCQYKRGSLIFDDDKILIKTFRNKVWRDIFNELKDRIYKNKHYLELVMNKDIEIEKLSCYYPPITTPEWHQNDIVKDWKQMKKSKIYKERKVMIFTMCFDKNKRIWYQFKNKYPTIPRRCKVKQFVYCIIVTVER